MEDIIEIEGKKYKKVASDLNLDRRHVYYNQEWYQLIQEEEKNWEILSVKGDRGDIFKYKAIHPTCPEEGECWWYGGPGQGMWTKFSSVGVSIHSIKRLSDGVVFSVGDRLRDFEEDDIIVGFDFHPETRELWAVTDKKNWYGGQIDCINKKPLFTTEDGKDIYGGEDCWSVYKVDNICKLGGMVNWKNPHPYPGVLYFTTKEAALSWIEKNQPKPLYITEDGVKLWNKEDKVYSILPKSHWPTHDELLLKVKHVSSFRNWKHFSSKEARDKYILENKPVLSFNDVIRITIAPGIGTWLKSGEIEELRELVKSKIK